MDAPAGRRDVADDVERFDRIDQERLESIVTSHETSPGRVVLTERHNVDGWLASDVAVDLEP